MITRIERYDFLRIFGASPRKLVKAEINEPIKYGDHVLRVQKKKASGGDYSEITFQDGREWYTLDLTSHWERGREDPITFNHDGACALAKAVLKQAADDLTKLYMGDYSAIEIEKRENETKAEVAKRFEIYRKMEQRRCEELLGTVLSRYCKIRAYWNKGLDIADIADRMNSTPEHIANVVHRLGLDRTNEDDDIVD